MIDEFDFEYQKNTNIYDFVNSKKKAVDNYNIIEECDGLESEDGINISFTKNCFACLSCVFTNDEHTAKFLNHFKEKDLLSLADELFKGELIEPVKALKRLNPKFRTLENFTETNETGHIQPWASTILDSTVSKGTNVRIGMEVQVQNEDLPRDGRLDVCAITDDYLLVLESKTTLEDGVKNDQQRFVSQFEKYVDDISNAAKVKGINYNILLLIGGKETDLLPSDHFQCSSREGDLANRFYSILEEKGIRFISANGLWGLALKFLKEGSSYSWDKLLPNLFNNDDVMGIITAGLVVRENGSYKIKQFD